MMFCDSSFGPLSRSKKQIITRLEGSANNFLAHAAIVTAPNEMRHFDVCQCRDLIHPDIIERGHSGFHERFMIQLV